jgi:GT2 family glycosyltransferase
MSQPLATIVVVPRERFSQTKRSLESVLAHAPSETPLVYVDGGSPPLVRQYLEQQAARRGFRLMSTERLVAPNQARNLGLAQVRTKYAALVDNDVVVTRGWLESLVECAEITGAWVVGPLCCQGEGPRAQVRSAGCAVELVERDGRPHFRRQRRHHGQPPAESARTLGREAVDEIELHAALLRSDVFGRLGPLDEQITSPLADSDLCLAVRSRGGEVYLEPAAAVTYLAPPPFDSCDLPYFQLRWSDAWNTASIERFRQKWRLAADDPALAALAEELAEHRRATLEGTRRLLGVLGRKRARWIERTLIAPFERALNRRKFPEAPHDEARELRKAA